jgi:flavin-dependent dehydrogenase
VRLTAEIAIVGAGPAGATAALMLAPFHETVLVDGSDFNPDSHVARRIGESLPAAARRLFRDMGLSEDFERQGHTPAHVARSRWGGRDPTWIDSLRDPDGPGWHLDREQFDGWLRARARARGAALVAPAKLRGLARTPDGWLLTLARGGRPLFIEARFVVDAGGRAAPLARALGARRARADRLICRWLHGAGGGGAGTRSVAAEPDGWWYSADLPGGRRVLAFHTDADLPAAKAMASAADLLACARGRPDVAELLDLSAFAPADPSDFCAAHSASSIAGGPGWLAVGDAVLACDPLSSQGLLNALYSGLMAAAAIRRALIGDSGAVDDYTRAMADVAAAYRVNLAAWYAMEARWPDRPFWARRHALSVEA